MCQAELTHDATMKYPFILTVMIMDETWLTLFNLETKHHSAQWKHAD